MCFGLPSHALLSPRAQLNYTSNHRATSVGHDLIKYYATYLAAYEDAHPKDVIPFGVNGAPHSASAAARAAAAPLRVGDRIQVWAPAEKVWRSAAVAVLAGEEEGVVTLTYEDGDSETLHMAQERWRRERLPGAGPSHKKRPAGGLGAEAAELGGAMLPAGEKRRRKRPTFFRQDFVGSDVAAIRAGAGAGGAAGGRQGGSGAPGGAGTHGGGGGHGGHGGGEESEEGVFPAFGSNLARLRARAERRRFFAPVTRRTAAFLAAAAPRAFPPASDVPHWLQLRGFGRLAPVFAAHEVDMEVLPLLTGEDLQDMGLHDFATRIELLVHVTAECNGRAAAEVDAALAGLTEREGEALAGVREAVLLEEEEEEVVEAEQQRAAAVAAEEEDEAPPAAEAQELAAAMEAQEEAGAPPAGDDAPGEAPQEGVPGVEEGQTAEVEAGTAAEADARGDAPLMQPQEEAPAAACDADASDAQAAPPDATMAEAEDYAVAAEGTAAAAAMPTELAAAPAGALEDAATVA
jgi:hypothetical protein